MPLTIFLLFMAIVAFGTVPAWPYARDWGYYPSGGLGLMVVILLVVYMLSPGHVWW
jgi:hypothetical protein